MLSINLALVIMGLAKIAFGVTVGVIGIFVASRVLARLLGAGAIDAAVRDGNVAVGVLSAASIVSLGLLAKQAVGAAFDAADLLYRGGAMEGHLGARLAGYALAHVVLALGVGTAVLAIGTYVFGKLTRGVDEIDEVKKNNVGAALVLGGVLVVLALVTAPGLQTALDGLLPLPALAGDELVAPS
ncbi:MAG TPA: DUF350 domain-containing protein [Byssovorax sp.]|jgi:uncharacterized membrane protein YjfL (UPF0719 family)